VRVLHDEQQVWRVSGGGWFIVDEAVGKHEFITYAAGLTADGSVKQIEIMDYRGDLWRSDSRSKMASPICR